MVLNIIKKEKTVERDKIKDKILDKYKLPFYVLKQMKATKKKS